MACRVAAGRLVMMPSILAATSCATRWPDRRPSRPRLSSRGRGWRRSSPALVNLSSQPTTRRAGLARSVELRWREFLAAQSRQHQVRGQGVAVGQEVPIERLHDDRSSRFLRLSNSTHVAGVALFAFDERHRAGLDRVERLRPAWESACRRTSASNQLPASSLLSSARFLLASLNLLAVPTSGTALVVRSRSSSWNTTGTPSAEWQIVELDQVGAGLDGRSERRQRVLGRGFAVAAMSDHQHSGRSTQFAAAVGLLGVARPVKVVIRPPIRQHSNKHDAGSHACMRETRFCEGMSAGGRRHAMRERRLNPP